MFISVLYVVISVLLVCYICRYEYFINGYKCFKVVKVFCWQYLV